MYAIKKKTILTFNIILNNTRTKFITLERYHQNSSLNCILHVQ